MMVILGIVGALVGGFIIGTVLGIVDVTGLNLTSLVGAVVVVFVAQAFLPRKAGRA